MAEITNITKTYVLGTDGVTYFEVVTTDYDDESQTAVKTRVGPVAQLVGDQADKSQRAADELAQSSRVVSRAKTTITELNNVDASITTLTGQSPLKVIQDRNQNFLTASGWQIDEGAGFVSLVFTVNAQGALRYSVNGGTTKGATMYGSIIRLNNYPVTGTNTDFHKAEGGKRYNALPNKVFTIKAP